MKSAIQVIFLIGAAFAAGMAVAQFLEDRFDVRLFFSSNKNNKLNNEYDW